MVKYFSADWLAQSHHSPARAEPHVPCMAQPRPPTFGEALAPSAPTEPAQSRGPQDARPRSRSRSRPRPSGGAASDSAGYSSGYDSEAASSECPSVDEGSEGDKDGPQRRARTKFTAEQISKLEKIFNKRRYVDAGERVKTAQRLSLTETQVRTWFQNRRMKLKRELQDYLAPQVPPLVFQALPALQYRSVAGQPPRFTGNQRAFQPLAVVFRQQMPARRPPPVTYERSFYRANCAT